MVESSSDEDTSTEEKITLVKTFIKETVERHKKANAFTKTYNSDLTRIQRDVSFFDHGVNGTLPPEWESVYEVAKEAKESGIVDGLTKFYKMKKEYETSLSSHERKFESLLTRVASGGVIKKSQKRKLVTEARKKDGKGKKKNKSQLGTKSDV